MTTDTSTFAPYVLRHGDDSLIMSQRLCEWVARAPRIEDDVALLNIALDHLGHARELLTAAADLEGHGRTEDDLAYDRPEIRFTNAQLFELDNGDFGQTIAKILCVGIWHTVLYESWARSSDQLLAEIGPRAARDCRYHVEYASMWATRLTGGTEESRARFSAGLDAVRPHIAELFTHDELTLRVAESGRGSHPNDLAEQWYAQAQSVLTPMGFEVPDTSASSQRAPGRCGDHLEGFGPMLAQLQHLRRSHPGGSW